MRKIDKKIRILFAFALGLSIGFPLGVLGIIFGAINGMIPLLIVGIVLAAAGFYGMPLLWVYYGQGRRDRRMLQMIDNEHIYTVSGLAAQMNMQEKEVREKLKAMIVSGDLNGYLLVDDTLELNTNLKQSARNRETKKCENCGAMMAFDGVKFICEYCGTVVKKK